MISLRLSSIPRMTTEFARRSFRVTVPQIWNDLLVNVQFGQSFHVFRSRLKTVHQITLTDVIKASERLCIDGFMTQLKCIIIIIIIIMHVVFKRVI